MKAEIVILSDPQGHSEEALGRIFYGLATAYELKQSGEDVAIVFAGAATRWPKALFAPEHPAHSLYQSVSDRVAGVSCGCANVFGAIEEVTSIGLPLLRENAVPGTTGLPSLRNWLAEGRQILTFLKEPVARFLKSRWRGLTTPSLFHLRRMYMLDGVFHEGERRVQERAGETEEANRNSPMITSRIPGAAIAFLQQQSLLIFAVRQAEDLWCLPVAGKAGWISASRDSISLDLERIQGTADERVFEAAKQSQYVGCIALDFATRQRLRINGRLERKSDTRLTLNASEAFPNCPKYITKRTLVWSDQLLQAPLRTGYLLTQTQQDLLQTTDTFFVATQHPSRGLDASHRGGNPGFVQCLRKDTLRFCDYPGNSLFNTLGNLEINAALGLLVPDFHVGVALAITGTASVSYEDQGRIRWVTMTVRSWTEVRFAVTETARQLSPFNPD